MAAFDDGHSLVMEKLGDVEIDTLPAPGKKDQMFLLGNEACALGAIAAGSVLWPHILLRQHPKLWNT